MDSLVKSMKHGEMRTRILDAGEAMVRHHGFNGVSFREIADEVGIKSASVHYHFPSKEDFALAVTDRYKQRFMEMARATLTGNAPLADRVSAYADLYRAAFRDDAKMCLCGMLAAEVTGLPESVREKVSEFFSENMDALRDATGDENSARMILASLQGGMLMARAYSNAAHIDAVAEDLESQFRNR